MRRLYLARLGDSVQLTVGPVVLMLDCHRAAVLGEALMEGRHRLRGDRPQRHRDLEIRPVGHDGTIPAATNLGEQRRRPHGLPSLGRQHAAAHDLA